MVIKGVNCVGLIYFLMFKSILGLIQFFCPGFFHYFNKWRCLPLEVIGLKPVNVGSIINTDVQLELVTDDSDA